MHMSDQYNIPEEKDIEMCLHWIIHTHTHHINAMPMEKYAIK